MNRVDALTNAYQLSLRQAREAIERGQENQAWEHLERAHILGQTRFTWHWQVHCRMLALALTQAKAGEIVGQLLRLALVPVGHVTGRLPIGNVGSTRVGALSSAPLPETIAELIATVKKEQR